MGNMCSFDCCIDDNLMKNRTRFRDWNVRRVLFLMHSKGIEISLLLSVERFFE